MADPNNTVLPSPPFDTISCIKYSPTDPDKLLVSSWDTSVRFYHAGEPNSKPSEQLAKFEHRAAILTCCFSDSSHGFSGGLDATIRHLEIGTEKMVTVGSHTDAVSGMVYSDESNALVSGSWDCSLRLWDPRASTPQQSVTTTPERVYCLDMTNHNIVVAMASRLFNIYDIRNMATPAQQRESSLKYMTRSLACMSDGQGYATASVEGRIAVEYFDPSPTAQAKKYAFKCHRHTMDDVDQVYPVNALAFHPVYNTFASAGSDATVSIWDHVVKKRLRQYPKFGNPVGALAFNCDGTRLAVGVGYNWDLGEKGMHEKPGTEICIRRLGDEVKPKNWSG
ncbi:WD40-repeat-containing domain protein [Roridomyces roridus]|uniref:WD40-repeat-containing domain protein n=1 Tax=Roridomyces roridus TaxID=1738132 RepID=A0AAD7BVM1_9AGAR|nr:WD40-repeat-containing domain protein [Roridomyces roridus]